MTITQIDSKRKAKMTEENSAEPSPQYEDTESWIAVVKYGDPNTHRQLQTSWGIFDSHEDAKAWVHGTYHGKNHIVDIISFNILEKVG